MPLFEDLPEEQATLAGPQFAVAPETTTLKPGLFADLPEQPALPTREAVKEETWRELGFGSKLQSDLLRAERGFKSTVGSVPKAISILGDVLPPLDTPLTSEQAAESASWVERQAGKTGAQRLAEIQASDFWRAGEQLQESVGEIPQPESVKRPLGSALEGAGSLAGTLMLAPLGPEAVMGNAFLMELTDAYESEIGRQTQNGEPVNPDAAAAKGLVYASGAMPLEWIGGAGRLARRWFGAAAEAEVKALAKQGGAKAAQQFFVNRIKDAGLEGGTEALQRLWQDAIVMGKPNIAAAIEEGASAFGGTLLLGAAGQGARAVGQQVQGAVDEAQAQAAIERSGRQVALEASLPEQGINYNRERDASFQDIPEEVPETGTDRTATTDESAVRAALAATPGGEVGQTPTPPVEQYTVEQALKDLPSVVAELKAALVGNQIKSAESQPDKQASRFNQILNPPVGGATPDAGGSSEGIELYHATKSDDEVRAFNPGTHFGTKEQAAAIPGAKRLGKGKVTLKNPLRVRDVGMPSPERFIYNVPELKELDDPLVTAPQTEKQRLEMWGQIRDVLEQKGYDGMVYLNKVEATKDLTDSDRFNMTDDELRKHGARDSYIIFRPEQVSGYKSEPKAKPAGGATPYAGGASEQDSISNHEEKLRYKRDIDDKHGRLVIQERDDIEFFGKDSPEAKASTKALRDFELENAAWIGAARRALAETGNSSSLPNVPKSRGKKKLGDVAVGQPVGNAPPPPRWQPTPGKQAVVNLTSRGRGRLAQVVAVQPDGSAQVRLQGEKEFRWVNADQLRPTGQEAARRAKAAELAEAATPEAAAKMQADAREFDTLVSEFGPHPDLNWLPAEALETTDVKSQGVVAGRLRESGRRNAARAAGVTNYQDNSVADRARALPALEAFLRAQFPGDTSIDRRRALEQFSRGETQPAAPQSEAARRVAGIVRRLAKKPGFELLQGIRAADSRGRGAPKARGSRDAAAAAKPAMEGDAGGVSGGKALVGSAGQKVFSELERLFGVRIVLVDHASGTVPFNGFYDADSRTILIDSRNDKPLLVVAGHELTHHIANTHPVLYQELQDKLVPLIQQHQQYYERMQARGDQLDQGTFKRELIGDFAGDALADPTFLESLARQEPNLFKRFARIAVSWLNKLIEKAKGAALKGYGVAQHVSDLEAARDALRLMLVDAARETQFARAGIKPKGQFSRKDDFAFDAPESVAEQRERLRVEKLMVENQKAKQAMQERAAARLTGNTDERTEDMFGGVAGRETRRDASGQGSLFSRKVNEVPTKFAMRSPIKGQNGAEIVGYEWRSMMGEKWSNREGGYVEARVSNWDDADKSTGTGREIVHVFYVKHPDGVIRPEGIRSAQSVLGINESRLMTIAKKERAAQEYRQQQLDADAAMYDRAAKDTPAEAARDFRVRNRSQFRTFEEDNQLFNESVLFEKGGKFVRRLPSATENMVDHGWTLVANDPAKPKRPTESGELPQELTDAVKEWRGAEKRYRRARRQEPSDVEDAQAAREEAEINFRMLAEKHRITQAQFDELTASAKATDTEQMADAELEQGSFFSRKDRAALVDELNTAEDERSQLRVKFQPIPAELTERIARLREQLFPKAPAEQPAEATPPPAASASPAVSKLQEQIVAAEAKLMAAIKQHMQPPEGMTKKEALQAKNDAASKLRRLVAEQLKAMSSANVDAVRSPQETADLISQTVDLLNSIQDEISERTAKDIEVPADLTKLRQDLQTRLNLLKGWADQETDGKGQKAEARTGPRDARFAAVESATDPARDSWGEWWDKIKRGLRYLTSPIPELPLFGEQARKSALFRRGYRLFAVESNRVRKEAADKLQRVLEPLTKLGRNPADNAALQRYYRLGEQLRRFEMDERKQQPIRAEMARLEAQLERDPFNLFRKIVLYRDLYWRGTYLKTPEGKPITLPLGLTPDDARQELRRLTDLVAKHKDGAAVAEALKRHYELTDELQKSILDHGEIIPEALRNPLYFPHHMIDSWTGNLDRVKPTTEEDFRRYLITPLGSGKLIQSDYLKAMMLHTADVLAHNARVDLVQKYWQPYDISERLKREHGEAWNKPWNLPPGYRLYAPFKKLPLRMDYILSREVLADKLGVLFNDGDLRERMGEVGKVLKVKPEDLHAALVAGEKIQWALPEEIADALEGITRREAAESNPGLGHAIGLPFRKLNSFWKATKLFAPWNWIRYEYGNLSTDAIDKVLAADPGAAKHLARAAREVWASGDPKFEASPEFAAAQREGVFDTVTAGEAGRLIELPAFREFMTPGEKRLDVVKRFLSGPARGSKFREATFRYANFLGNLERLRAGNEPVYAGAFHGDIDALGEDVDGQRRMLEGEELNYAKAAEISLKTFGDYQQLGVAGRWLRQYAVPFWSWQDVNFRYHANQLRNLADGLMGKQGDVTTARKAALRYAGVRVISTLVAVGLAKELWNQFGGALAGLWDDDDDLEKNLSATDRRRGHIILGQDANGQTMVVYTPSAWSDIAEWVGGQNMKRLLLEWARGQITLDQVVSDYAKMLGPDSLNKLAQSVGPIGKSFYELTSGKATFPDVFDQRNIPAADKYWRLIGTLTDDRIVNSLRAAFDRDFYSQPASEQLQQIILQVRRRDPESWAYYEVREDAADWKEARTGKRFEAGAYDAPEAMALRNFRRAIYRGDVANALRFYERLQDYGYTAERLDASIRAQHPLADLNAAERKAFVAGLTAGQRRELDLALKYYGRMSVLDKREKQLFPSKRQPNQPANPALLERIVEGQRRNQ